MDLAVEILFEDEDLVVANKPSGVLSEGGGARETDLEQMVSRQVGRKAFCCHRLDRLTSGLVLLRKNARWRAALAELFEKRLARKEYWLLVEGPWDKRVHKVETHIAPLGGGRWGNTVEGGKLATSTFQVLGTAAGGEWSWLRGLLKTGRTHQLRLHCQHAGHPIVGDPLYGTGALDGLFGLHGRALALPHPKTGARLQFEAEPPRGWARYLAGFAPDVDDGPGSPA